MTKSSILFVMGLLLMAFPAFAQDSTQWSAYLFDYINQALIRVSSHGESQSYSLGIPEGGLISSLSINEDGSQVAYCYSYPDATVEWGNKLIVRDIDHEANILEQNLPTGLLDNCAVTAFKSDVLALSVVYPYNHETPAENRWELRLIDPITGENIAVLDSDNPTMPEFQIFDWVNLPITAKVSELSREHVSFIAIPFYGGDIPPDFDAFEWNVTANAVEQLPAAYGHINSDTLPETGEVVYAMLDETVPAAMPAGPIPQANVVKISDANGERTIYQTSDWVITATSFVSNGQAVLISMIPGFDEENPDAMGGSRFALVQRDGTVIEFPDEYVGAAFVDAVPNGALLAFTPQLATGGLESTQIFILTSENILALDSFVTVDYSLGWSPPQLVWTSPSSIATDLSPFLGQ